MSAALQLLEAVANRVAEAARRVHLANAANAALEVGEQAAAELAHLSQRERQSLALEAEPPPMLQTGEW